MKPSALTARPGKNKKIDVLFNGTKLTSDAGAMRKLWLRVFHFDLLSL